MDGGGVTAGPKWFVARGKVGIGYVRVGQRHGSAVVVAGAQGMPRAVHPIEVLHGQGREGVGRMRSKLLRVQWWWEGGSSGRQGGRTRATACAAQRLALTTLWRGCARERHGTTPWRVRVVLVWVEEGRERRGGGMLRHVVVRAGCVGVDGLTAVFGGRSSEAREGAKREERNRTTVGMGRLWPIGLRGVGWAGRRKRGKSELAAGLGERKMRGWPISHRNCFGICLIGALGVDLIWISNSNQVWMGSVSRA